MVRGSSQQISDTNMNISNKPPQTNKGNGALQNVPRDQKFWLSQPRQVRRRINLVTRVHFIMAYEIQWPVTRSEVTSGLQLAETEVSKCALIYLRATTRFAPSSEDKLSWVPHLPGPMPCNARPWLSSTVSISWLVCLMRWSASWEMTSKCVSSWHFSPALATNADTPPQFPTPQPDNAWNNFLLTRCFNLLFVFHYLQWRLLPTFSNGLIHLFLGWYYFEHHWSLCTLNQ